MKAGISVLLMTFSQLLWAGSPKPVTLMVDDVPVVQVLQALAAQEKRNLVVSPDVGGSLSLHLQAVPWRQALKTVVSSAGLVMRERAAFFIFTARRGNVNSRREGRRSRPSGSLMRHWSPAVSLLPMRMPASCRKWHRNC